MRNSNDYSLKFNRNGVLALVLDRSSSYQLSGRLKLLKLNFEHTFRFESVLESLIPVFCREYVTTPTHHQTLTIINNTTGRIAAGQSCQELNVDVELNTENLSDDIILHFNQESVLVLIRNQQVCHKF